jgi:hypothetical protein
MKLGALSYAYSYNNVSFSGSLSSAATVYIPGTGVPLLKITDGWSTNSCCSGYTLYLMSGIPPHSNVSIAINTRGMAPQSCCGGTMITVENGSPFPVEISAADQRNFYLMPQSSQAFQCDSPRGTNTSSVRIGPYVGGLSPITRLCTGYGPTSSRRSWLSSVSSRGLESLTDCLNDVECTTAFMSETEF